METRSVEARSVVRGNLVSVCPAGGRRYSYRNSGPQVLLVGHEQRRLQNSNAWRPPRYSYRNSGPQVLLVGYEQLIFQFKFGILKFCLGCDLFCLSFFTLFPGYFYLLSSISRSHVSFQYTPFQIVKMSLKSCWSARSGVDLKDGLTVVVVFGA